MSGEDPLPLDGVRVLDFGQFIAVPFCTQWLGWLGAEIITIESRRHMISRTAPPFAAGMQGNPNATGYHNLLYSAKKSCTLDMSTDAGRDLARRLAGVCDVVVDNFSTGVMEKMGLSWETLSALNPRLIMLSCGAFGRSGPMRGAMGFHSAVNLFSGVADVTGYAGGHGRLMGGVLPDPMGGAYAAFAIQAALLHRARTGEGQFIDQAMYESMMALIPEAVVDYTLNGVEPERIGNRDRVKVPHGIFPCRDADSWIAISVEGEAEWYAFCDAAGQPGWLRDPRFATVEARHEHVAALDGAVEDWTRGQELLALVDRLQAAGIASGPVQRSNQLLDDPQLKARGMIIDNVHPVAGTYRQLGLPWRMDSLGVSYRRAALLGEHTREILTGLLGLDEAEYARLEADGVLA